jgi:hypothetical protein
LDIFARPPGTGFAGSARLSLPLDQFDCFVPISRPLMTTPPGRADAAVAGMLLIAAILGCAAAGFGLGSLVGLAVPLGIAGLFLGVVVGVALVHARFRRL